jgi:hypothetical protein
MENFAFMAKLRVWRRIQVLSRSILRGERLSWLFKIRKVKIRLIGLIFAVCFLSACNLSGNNASQPNLPEAGKEEAFRSVEASLSAGLNFTSFGNEASATAESLDQEMIKEAFVRKAGRPPAELAFEITQKNGDYASGSFAFANETDSGWWLAAKVGSTWQVVAEGNGPVACERIESYNFPATMVPECYDQESGETIRRD